MKRCKRWWSRLYAIDLHHQRERTKEADVFLIWVRQSHTDSVKDWQRNYRYSQIGNKIWLLCQSLDGTTSSTRENDATEWKGKKFKIDRKILLTSPLSFEFFFPFDGEEYWLDVIFQCRNITATYTFILPSLEWGASQGFLVPRIKLKKNMPLMNWQNKENLNFHSLNKPDPLIVGTENHHLYVFVASTREHIWWYSGLMVAEGKETGQKTGPIIKKKRV